jgi:FtsH-binding integral membrane protein
MMLIGLIVASIINIFWGNGVMDFIISCVGIVIFSCFTAYHTQSLLELGTCEDETVRAKGAVMGALALYLDFINLFLILLRFFGGRDE